MQSLMIPMTVVSISVTTQISMLLLYYPWAVYVGLVALMLNRPSILAVGNPFVRVRYVETQHWKVIYRRKMSRNYLSFYVGNACIYTGDL